MTTRGTDWGKWLYRVVIVVGLVFGYVTAHPNKLRYWLYAWRDVSLVVVVPPVMAVAIWIVVRRPRWPAACSAVIAVIAVWTILFPIFAKTDVPEPSQSCQSNLKQLTLACRQYLDDFDGRLPAFEQRWPEALLPYLKNEQVFQCPQAWAEHRPTADERQALPLTYGLNPYLLGHDLRSTPHPERVIMFYCGDDAGPVARHHDLFHFSYLDEHVKAVGPGQDPGVWNPWEPAP